ncbi:putative beta-D-xylosidase 7 [Bienertia sinuspersici]
MKLLLILTLLQLIQIKSTRTRTRPLFACNSANPSTKSHQFCNTKLPINKRVNDLISKLSLDEKISQLTNSAPPIQRLGVPAYEWWSESLHGVSRHGRGYRFNGTFDESGTIVVNGTAIIKAATMFPQIIRCGSVERTSPRDSKVTGSSLIKSNDSLVIL